MAATKQTKHRPGQAAASGRRAGAADRLASTYVMMTVTVKRLVDPAVLAEALAATKSAPVIIRIGKKPVAAICAVPEKMSIEDLYWSTNPELQKQIQRSRASEVPLIPHEEAMRRLGLRPSVRKRDKSKGR